MSQASTSASFDRLTSIAATLFAAPAATVAIKAPDGLFLHGGPGDATNPWGYLAFRSWLKHFTVVQWDQRGAGRTLGRSGPQLRSCWR